MNGSHPLAPGAAARLRLLRLAAALTGLLACGPLPQKRVAAESQDAPAQSTLIGVGDPLVGRVNLDDRLLILTASHTLLEVRPASGTVVRRRLSGLDPGERVRGLAHLADGTLWTLVGRDEFVELSVTGPAGRRLRLPGPVVSVYGSGHRLVYQAVDFEPPAPALLATIPDAALPQPWGPLRTRVFQRPRAEAMVLNLVVCGMGSDGLTPCWFASGNQMAVVDVEGNGQLFELRGLRMIQPEAWLYGEISLRPLRDAFARSVDDVWVLGTDVLGPASGAEPSWQLVRFDSDGTARQAVALEQPCRMVLGMSRTEAYLLATDGRIVRVKL